MLIATASLLAQLPEGHGFVSPVKLVLMVALFAFWAWFAQWVDKDAVAVNTFRILWNLIDLSVGTVATLLLLFVPNFAIGALLFVVAVGVFLGVYVVHRNGLVQEQFKVLTPGHFQRIMREGFSGKRKLKDVKERVRIKGADGKWVAIPSEEAPREQYRLTQDLFFDMLWRRASLVELAPAGEAAKLVYTIDGVAADRDPLVRAEGDAIVLYLKTIAGLNLEERRKPQKGKLLAQVGENKYEVIVRTDGSTAGEKVTLRLLAGESFFKIGNLGFTEAQLEAFRSVMQGGKGVVLLSGPPGSGLTTTVYSVARSNDAFLQNIQMLEYTKEVDVDNITQITFSAAENRTFASELQKIVRTDPDIVVLPELREKAAAVIASQAAVAKQKVYVGLSAADVFGALQKWLELVGDNALVAKSLLAVSNQRLVRVLCAACKQPYKPDPAQLRKINMPPDQVLHRPPEPTYDKHGNPIICQNCQGTGYVGRAGVFDLLLVDEGMRGVVAKSTSVRDVQSYAAKKGALGIQQHALQKVLAGATSIQEVVRATKSPSAATAEPAAAPAAKPKPASGARAPSGKTP